MLVWINFHSSAKDHRGFQALLYTIVLTSDTTSFPCLPLEVVLKSQEDTRKEEADNRKPKTHHGLALSP